MTSPSSIASVKVKAGNKNPLNTKWLTPAILLITLNIFSTTAFAYGSYVAGASATLNLISITDSQGNDASNFLAITVEPDTGPVVTDNASTTGDAIAVVDGLVGSSNTNPPSSGYNLEQSSSTQGIATEGRAFSSHGTEANLVLTLINNPTDTSYTLNFELRYSAFADATITGSHLIEYATAYADFLIFDSLSQVFLEQEFNFGLDGGYGISGNLNDSYQDTILFSINLDPSNFVDSITLRTYAHGDTQSIPLPATLWLFTLGLTLLGLGKQKTIR